MKSLFTFAAMPTFAVRILLFFQIALAAAPLSVRHELAHLPALVEHFLEHTEADHAHDFSDFWSLHFGKKAEAHADEHDHSSLPSEHHGTGCSMHFSPIFAENQPVFDVFLLKTLPVEPLCSASFFQKTMRSAQHLGRIWQPPKA